MHMFTVTNMSASGSDDGSGDDSFSDFDPASLPMRSKPKQSRKQRFSASDPALPVMQGGSVDDIFSGFVEPALRAMQASQPKQPREERQDQSQSENQPEKPKEYYCLNEQARVQIELSEGECTNFER